MELLQLKYFKTVAEIGKISAAAEAMFISAPALSTSISRLEKELGMPLFDRTNNSIILNRQGQIFLRHVNQVFAALDCAKVELRQSATPQSHHVSVATYSSHSWADLIPSFSQEHPELSLSLTSMRVTQFTANGLLPQYTFLLANERLIPPSYSQEMDSIPLLADHTVVLVDPSHPLAQKKQVTLADLENEHLLLPMQDYAFYELLMRVFAENDYAVPTANSYSSLVCNHMVAQGLGVAFSSLEVARTMHANLHFVPLAAKGADFQMRLYWRKNRSLTPEEVCFLSFVKKFYRIDT